jgi:hypothetical protein
MNPTPWKVWLAFEAGRIEPGPGCYTSGRDVLRTVRAKFDQMGAPLEEWPAIEQAALQGQTAIGISASRARYRIVSHLAGGEYPIGPLERIQS